LFTEEEEEGEGEEEQQQQREQQQQQQRRTSFSIGRVENIVARQLRNHGSIPDTVRNLSLLASIQTCSVDHTEPFQRIPGSKGARARG
jgi:hypothetical protein